MRDALAARPAQAEPGQFLGSMVGQEALPLGSSLQPGVVMHNRLLINRKMYVAFTKLNFKLSGVTEPINTVLGPQKCTAAMADDFCHRRHFLPSS